MNEPLYNLPHIIKKLK